MQISDYIKLKSCGFLGYGGCIQSYWSIDDRKHDLPKIIDEIGLQILNPLDFRNCVIIFPLASSMGSTCLINDVPLDHCTNVLSIVDFLGRNGVRWKDGSIMKSGQHLSKIGMLIVTDGVAVATTTADPTNLGFLSYHPGISDKNLYYRHSEGDPGISNNSDLIFSGMFIEKFIRKK
jgi:hypothetical protein